MAVWKEELRIPPWSKEEAKITHKCSTSEAPHKETIRHWSLVNFRALGIEEKSSCLYRNSAPYAQDLHMFSFNHPRKLLINGFLDVMNLQKDKFHYTG